MPQVFTEGRVTTIAAPKLYYPYGEMRGGSEVATDYRYTGQRWQSALGLYYYRARWYDPQMRRFIQADTIVPEPGNPQTLNRYAYALNNPVRYNDPTGMFTEQELLEYGFDQSTINQWRSDWDWWGLISLAQLGDQVRGAHWGWDGWTERAGGVFVLGNGNIPGTALPFERLQLEGYQGGLRQYHDMTQGRSLWRDSGAGYARLEYGNDYYRNPGTVVGTRPVVWWHPERVDWISVMLGGIGTATTIANEFDHAKRTSQLLGQWGVGSDGAQLALGGSNLGDGSGAEIAVGMAEIALSVALQYAPHPGVQIGMSVIDLVREVAKGVEVEYLELVE